MTYRQHPLSRRHARLMGIGLVAMLACLALPVRGEAITLGFSCVTANSPQCGTIDDTFYVDVGLMGSDVAFTFYNPGHPTFDTGAIADIYFDLPSGLFGAMDIDDDLPGSGSVEFSAGATPPNLPGGNPIGFSADQSADSDAPVAQNAIGEDEFLRISFALFGTSTFDDVLTALTDGTMRLGLHVQSIAYGRKDYSDSFVSDPYSPPTNPTPVPEPASMLLLGSGLAGIAGYARRRRQQAH